MVVAYLIAVVIHGLWNGLALLTLSNFVEVSSTATQRLLQTVGQVAPLGLGILILVALVFIWIANRNLQ